MLRKALNSSEFIFKIVKFALFIAQKILMPVNSGEKRKFEQDYAKPYFLLYYRWSCLHPYNAQQEDNLKSTIHRGSSHLASLDIDLPVGEFAKSHFAGVGLNYSWSNHRFGKNIAIKSSWD